MKRRKILYGGDYNPEQWLKEPEILEKDIAYMKEAKINTVSMGMFSWSRRKGITRWIGWRRGLTCCTKMEFRPFSPRLQGQGPGG